MGNLKEIPVSLEGDPIFKKLFDIAEISNLTPAEMNAYQQSLKIKRDNYNHDQYILEQGEARGRQEERAKAEQEKKEIAIQMARKMLTAKEPLGKITEYTGLSITEIEVL